MADKKIITPLTDLEEQRKGALAKLEVAYSDTSSPLYRDNERYSWAVNTLNKKYEQLRNDLIIKSKLNK